MSPSTLPKPAARAAALLGLLGALALPARAEREPAQSADRFVDSIGVCTHWTYPDTPYGFAYEGVKRLLVASGIRHIRDGFNPRIVELARLGVKTTVLAEPEFGAPGEIQKKVKAINAEFPCIDAVEGPNEPDLFWVKNHKTYKGQGFPEGPLAFQKELYAALKGDPATAKLTVIGPSLGVTYDPGGGHPNPFGKGVLTDYVDWGNFHPYPGGNPFSFPFPYAGIEKYIWHGNFPSGNLDEFPYALNTYAPPFAPKPMCATETGYSTDRSGPTETVHAKYMPRLFCEYFRKGIRRAYSYEFIDEFPDPDNGNREAHFGLVRRNLTPKPAYYAVKSLIGILQEKGDQAGFQPGALDYTLTVRPAGEFNRTQYVHHLLLQKSDGDFYLLLWHEIANEDASRLPHRQINPPDMPATLTLSQPVRRAAVYMYDAAWNLTPQPVTLQGGALELRVPDHVMIVRLTPGEARRPGR